MPIDIGCVTVPLGVSLALGQLLVESLLLLEALAQHLALLIVRPANDVIKGVGFSGNDSPRCTHSLVGTHFTYLNFSIIKIYYAMIARVALQQLH